MKINCILTISQDISGKIVDMPNNLTIKVYCNSGALPDLANSGKVGTTRDSLVLKSIYISVKLIFLESNYYATNLIFSKGLTNSRENNIHVKR